MASLVGEEASILGGEEASILGGEKSQKKVCLCVCTVRQCINHTDMHAERSLIERRIIFGFLVL